MTPIERFFLTQVILYLLYVTNENLHIRKCAGETSNHQAVMYSWVYQAFINFKDC